MKSLGCVRLFATPWTAAHQAPLSMGFSRKEYWSGVPLPSLKREFYITFLLQSPTGEGNGTPLQCSCLENHMDRGAWWAAAQRVPQSWTRLKRLSMHACIGEGNGSPLQCSCLENPRDGVAWWAAVYGVAQSQTRLKRLSSSIHIY